MGRIEEGILNTEVQRHGELLEGILNTEVQLAPIFRGRHGELLEGIFEHRGTACPDFSGDGTESLGSGILIFFTFFSKPASNLVEEHEAQLLNYLRATNMEVGLLLNFGTKPQIRRKIFDNHLKKR